MDSIEDIEKELKQSSKVQKRLGLVYTIFPGLKNTTNQYLIDAGEQLKEIGLKNGRPINTIPVTFVQQGVPFCTGNNTQVIIIAPSNNNPSNSGPPREKPRIIPPQLPFFTKFGAKIYTLLEQTSQTFIGIKKDGNKVTILSPVCKLCYDVAYTQHHTLQRQP